MNTNRFISEGKTFFHIARSQIVTVPCACIFSVSLLIILTYSAILGITLILSYLFGSYASHIVYPRLPGLLRPAEVPVVNVFGGCTVCGDPNCGRQKPVGEHQPWVGLDVPREIDQALQDLLNKLLNEFVGSWFVKFSRDESFLWEIRERLRFACSILLRRLLRTDVGEVICERLVPIYLRHVEDYVVASDGCRSDDDKLATVVSHLGERIHPAARSRQAELEYLKAVSRTLSKLGLYQQELLCRAVSILLVELLAGWLLLTLSDTLCSPYIINTLLWLAASSDKLPPVSDLPTHKVQFLKSFNTRPFRPSTSVLRSDLSKVLMDQKLLYPLMQYLKRCGAVHLLQFCLDVEDFNRRLLVPEVSPATATELFKEAWDLYSLYLTPGSPDTIHCSPGLGEQLHQVLSRGGDDIARLQTSTPLFQAYEETFCLLEQTYLPGFYQSDLYFNVICSRRDPVGQVKVQQKNTKEPLVSKLSQKLQKLVSGQQSDSSGLMVEAACDATDMDCVDELDLGEFEFRDMSDWQVRIPIAKTEQDVNSRPYPIFMIRVLAENDGETWEVKRKFNDFYTLQTKLLEFHQKLVEELPPKKGLFSPRGEQYLESRRQSLERYLQLLVQQPELRCSDLLHCFLRSQAEFQVALHNPISLYGMLRRSVEPMKLRKERGRHLDAFFTSLCASIESPAKSELLYEITAPQQSKRDITRGIFGDNLAAVLTKTAAWPASPVRLNLRLSTFWDCILYAMWRLFGCASWLQRLVLVIKSALGDAGIPIVHSQLNHSIQSLLLPRLPHLIRQLQSAVLSPSKTHSPQDAAQLRHQVTEVLTGPPRSVLDRLFRLLVPRWQDGVTTAIDTLQHPTLNKNLFYNLLDEVLRSLFSEFSAPPPTTLP